MARITVVSGTQRIVVEPQTSGIVVVNAGPPGEPGPDGPDGQEALVQVATEAETLAGVSNTTLISPLRLQQKFDDFGGTPYIGPYTTAEVPSASTVDAGTFYFDTTTGQPLWSNGSSWVGFSPTEGIPQGSASGAIAWAGTSTGFTDPEPPPPPPGPELWVADYTNSPWWAEHGVIGVAFSQSHDMATAVVTDPLGEEGLVVRARCLPGTVLDTGGTCYGFTDRCSFEQMGMIDSDNDGMSEMDSTIWFSLPTDWGEAEDDVRWRTMSGSCKMPNTFTTYDPSRGSGSVPYSNNFAALAWAASVGCVLKGPPGATDYDRDRNRPSTFHSVARAAGQTRAPTPNGTAVSMIQIYWHYNVNPNDWSNIGTAGKPYVYIERGVWHKIRTYIRANTAGANNGVYQVWYDDDLVMHMNDLRLMPTIARGINLWHNQYFHGGPYGVNTQQTMYLGPASFV